ncbi:hypothetical protein [Methanobrevibacter sp.]|uniref:hypothetical protein n=1 Tax=Methanobrevibacter sp. TaxID=66852 RepID=UPI0038650154
MKKIIIILCAIIIVLVAFIGVNTFTSTSNANSIMVGNTSFIVPEGYISINNNGSTNITNGNNSIGLVCYADNDVNKHVKDYEDSKKLANESVSVSEFEVKNIKVYKSDLGDSKTFHYWFLNNGEVYELHTWDGDSNTDQVIHKLVESIT